jgi:tetrahydromethanopterin S-methyltransferase subunit B
MSFWTAAVIIVAIWGFVELRKQKIDRDLGVVRDEDGNPVIANTDDRALAHEVSELRERVKVLERITTEMNTLEAVETRRIAKEIEQLRDK